MTDLYRVTLIKSITRDSWDSGCEVGSKDVMFEEYYADCMPQVKLWLMRRGLDFDKFQKWDEPETGSESYTFNQHEDDDGIPIEFKSGSTWLADYHLDIDKFVGEQ